MNTKNILIKYILFFILSIALNSITVPTIASGKSFNNLDSISKEYVFKLIKNQSKESYDSIDSLSYKVIDLNLDDNPEIVAKMDGGVHLGYFYIFHKNVDGRYKLIAEKLWKVDRWDFDNYYSIGDIKIYEVLTRTGGSGLDIKNVNLWYIKDGKFYEAWEGLLYEASAFKYNIYFKMGGYQFNDIDNKMYYWLSKYAIKYDKDFVTYATLDKLKTVNYIFKFDGTKFILDTQNKCK